MTIFNMGRQHGREAAAPPDDSDAGEESNVDPHWGDGRLVVRRPEVPDSDIAAMSVIRSIGESETLSRVVRSLVEGYTKGSGRDGSGAPPATDET